MANSLMQEVQVIPRNEIPAIYSVNQTGIEHRIGELRDFQWHPLLKQFIPEQLGISFSWTRLRGDEILQPHLHPEQSIIIIVKGNGRLLGQKNLPLTEGDTVVVPPGCAHGFQGDGGEGFCALSIQFAGGLYTHPEQARVAFVEK